LFDIELDTWLGKIFEEGFFFEDDALFIFSVGDKKSQKLFECLRQKFHFFDHYSFLFREFSSFLN